MLTVLKQVVLTVAELTIEQSKFALKFASLNTSLSPFLYSTQFSVLKFVNKDETIVASLENAMNIIIKHF